MHGRRSGRRCARSEEALKELERIVARSESGEAQLQEAIDLYERRGDHCAGTKLRGSMFQAHTEK